MNFWTIYSNSNKLVACHPDLTKVGTSHLMYTECIPWHCWFFFQTDCQLGWRCWCSFGCWAGCWGRWWVCWGQASCRWTRPSFWTCGCSSWTWPCAQWPANRASSCHGSWWTCGRRSSCVRWGSAHCPATASWSRPCRCVAPGQPARWCVCTTKASITSTSAHLRDGRTHRPTLLVAPLEVGTPKSHNHPPKHFTARLAAQLVKTFSSDITHEHQLTAH